MFKAGIKLNLMNIQLHFLLYFYGAFLIICGIVSVVFIGLKAKTALASGGISGMLAIFIGYWNSTGAENAHAAGIALAFMLLVVFAWRSSKTLSRIFELIQTSTDRNELNGKGTAFLIISLMAVVSIFVLMLQICIS
jgi:hypothetical protein